MIYIYHGNDREKIQTKSQELVASLLAKKPDASVFHVSSQEGLNEYIESQGLFAQKFIVIGDNILAEFADDIERIKDSPNIFIFKEEKIDKKIKADKIQEFNKVEKKDDYNIFGIANAVGDKKKLWLSYIDAKNRGIADEQIHGILFWKLKTTGSPYLGSLVDVYHEARRGGDMSLLLEKWILTV